MKRGAVVRRRLHRSAAPSHGVCHLAVAFASEAVFPEPHSAFQFYIEVKSFTRATAGIARGSGLL
jgi:hypothetical protein